MSNKIKKAIFGSDKTPLKFGALEIPCYVLEDGTRVLSRSGIQKAIGYAGRSGEMLTRLVTAKNGFPDEVVAGVSTPIPFKRVDAGGSQPASNGYEATLFIDICYALIDLNRAGVLNEIQQEYAVFAEIIIRSVAKVGIIALIDEVTGYQNVRVADALNDILNKLLLEEAKKYEVTFPLELYKQWFKLNNWEWKPENAQKRPGAIAKWTIKLIYKRIAPGLLKQLEIRNPKNEKGYREHKHFQFLTDEIGTPKLREFFGGLIALAKATTTWRKYIDMVNRVYPEYGETMFLDFPDND